MSEVQGRFPQRARNERAEGGLPRSKRVEEVVGEFAVFGLCSVGRFCESPEVSIYFGVACR